jgi:hypothetical protein
MDSTASRFVPKVHPVTRPIEPEDPFALNATPVSGDPDLMIRAVVLEYAWLGWSADQIISLFRDPFFPLLHGLWQTLGESELRARIASLVATSGIFRFRSTIVETPADAESDSFDDLISEDTLDDGMPPTGFQRSVSFCQHSRDLPFVSLEVLANRSQGREGGRHD